MQPTTTIPTTTTIINGPSLNSYISNNDITYSKTYNISANIIGYIGEDLYNNNNNDFMRACELCSTLIDFKPCIGVVYNAGQWKSVLSVSANQYNEYLYLGNKEATKPVETTTQTPVGIQETSTINTTPSP
jgi:hypothetical protein